MRKKQVKSVQREDLRLYRHKMTQAGCEGQKSVRFSGREVRGLPQGQLKTENHDYAVSEAV